MRFKYQYYWIIFIYRKIDWESVENVFFFLPFTIFLFCILLYVLLAIQFWTTSLKIQIADLGIFISNYKCKKRGVAMIPKNRNHIEVWEPKNYHICIFIYSSICIIFFNFSFMIYVFINLWPVLENWRLKRSHGK